ncbi:MAG: hypothetical protein H6828_12450 [Planctomycetes bacterium]|nr:hypothetical protein [Planctomycetota bacterium]
MGRPARARSRFGPRRSPAWAAARAPSARAAPGRCCAPRGGRRSPAPGARAAALVAGPLRTLTRAALLGVAVWALVLYGARWCVHRVAPGEVGVRVSEWGGGVALRDYGPGLYLGLPGAQAWYALPAGTEQARWRADAEGAGGLLSVRTQDGNEVLVALSVPFHVRPGEAHRIVADGARHDWRDKVRARCEAQLLTELGRLSSEEFFDSDARAARLAETLVHLDEALADVHVEAEAVLIEDVRFPAAYEKKLQETQLEGLRGKMLAAKSEVAVVERELGRERQALERDLLARRIELDGVNAERKRAAKQELEELERETARYVSERGALAEREYAAQALEGERALLAAQGLEAKLRNAVYASEGGRLYLAQQAARATRLEAVTLDSTDPRVPNPLDPAAMTRLFTGE